jgi:hypothetical protein
MLEAQCDTPIVEALLWSQMWAVDPVRRAPRLTVVDHDIERKLARACEYDLIIDYSSEPKAIGRWNSATETIMPLTEYDRALAVALHCTV